MKIVIQQPKRRMHKALFDRQLPFAPKTEQSKKMYNRKEKYKVDYRFQEA